MPVPAILGALARYGPMALDLLATGLILKDSFGGDPEPRDLPDDPYQDLLDSPQGKRRKRRRITARTMGSRT